jgi:hypothetical protein
MKNSNPTQNQGMSISSFFLTYIIPKKGLKSELSKTINSKHLQKSLLQLVNQYNVNKSSNSTDIEIISCDRFFDARMAFHLNLEEELRELMMSLIEGNYSFTKKAFDDNVTIMDSKSCLDLLDYIDLGKHQELNMDKDAHYFIVPVFVLSSKPEQNPTRDIFSIFHNKQLYNNVLMNMHNSNIISNISVNLPKDKPEMIFFGLFENEGFVSKYILDLRPQISPV